MELRETRLRRRRQAPQVLQEPRERQAPQAHLLLPVYLLLREPRLRQRHRVSKFDGHVMPKGQPFAQGEAKQGKRRGQTK